MINVHEEYNLPTLLTLARLILSPVILPGLLVVLLPFNLLPINMVLAAIFAAFGLTDYFDGYFARKHDQVTPLGRLLDPVADKLLVTSTLVANGHNPRFAIGSVNLSEFFVTFAEAVTFFALIGLVRWQILVGLVVGGVLAAPIAAYVCKRIPTRALMIIVGVVITVLSVRTILLTVV